MKTQLKAEFNLRDVLVARERLRGGIVDTPCLPSPGLSQLTGSRIYCKREDLQRTGSFKERGARNALSVLMERRQARGVVAASAGNHALGLAWHARTLGVPVTVVMPHSAAQVKIEQCRRLGAEVLLAGETFDEARAYAISLGQERGAVHVHPFDDPSVIAGQGTVALEVLEQLPDFDAMVVPVGGGGLLAGVSTVLRALRPKVRIFGVEPEHAPSFSKALNHGEPVSVQTRRTLADGLAVARAGACAFDIAARLVDKVVTVEEWALALAIKSLDASEGLTVEGAGAAPLAALLNGRLPELRGKRVVLLLTGRNIDPAVHRRAISGGASCGAPASELTV